MEISNTRANLLTEHSPSSRPVPAASCSVTFAQRQSCCCGEHSRQLNNDRILSKRDVGCCCCCEHHDGKLWGTSSRPAISTGPWDATRSYEQPPPPQVARHSLDQEMRSSHDQIRYSLHTPYNKLMGSPHRMVSAASLLTPAEELISAINKLNLKIERYGLKDEQNGCISTGDNRNCSGPSPQPPASTPSHSASKRERALHRLRQGLIGHALEVQTPFGTKLVIYADWAASGRLLWQVERFMIQNVYPLYANVHTEVGTCANATGQRFEEARASVARCVDAPQQEYAVVFTGSGMTGAAFKLAHLLGLGKRTAASKRSVEHGRQAVVMYSIMEHHSNCLLWRELDCQTVVIGEDQDGLPDLQQLEEELQKHAGAPLIVGSFSAGSNVTGIAPDVHKIAALLHRHGAIAAFDYASAGSSHKVSCVPTGAQHKALDRSLDAVMISPHKLVGGPGACGVLVVRRSIVRTVEPQSPGGGTVSYVNGTQHWYEDNIERREEAGTPDVLGAIRCALAMQIHSTLGPAGTHGAGVAHVMRALHAWKADTRIDVVGSDRRAFWDEHRRLPLISFNIVVPLRRGDSKRGAGVGALEGRRKALLHPQYVAAVLSDVFGVQARAGCACAGPYGQVLLQRQLVSQCGCTGEDLQAVDRQAAAGDAWVKPGWVRVYFSFLMSTAEVDYIIRAVQEAARHGHKLLPSYILDVSTGTFKHRSSSGITEAVTTGAAVKAWLGREQSNAGEHSNTVQQLRSEEADSLHSMPRQTLDEDRLQEQLQQQLHAGSHILLHPPEALMPHPALAAHVHPPGRDVRDSHARWFLLPEESSLVAEDDDFLEEPMHTTHTRSSTNLTESWSRSQRSRATPHKVRSTCAGHQTPGGQCQSRQCQVPRGRGHVQSSLGSDTIDGSGHSRRRPLSTGPAPRSSSAGGPRAAPGSAHARPEARPLMASDRSSKYRARPRSGSTAAGRPYSCWGVPGNLADARTSRACEGEQPATGRLSATVVRSPAKGKHMNDSDRARAAIAAGKAALAASMRRRKLRSCPPR
eukprot:jgi/Ulvmu1/7023/UM033_0082.1